MYISNNKIKYALKDAVNIIQQSIKYDLSMYDSIDSTMKFESHLDDVTINWKNNKISNITISKGTSTNYSKKILGSLKIENDDSKNKEEFSKILEEGFKKIRNMEEAKFISMFPEYDVSIDRDMKLDELFSEKKKEIKTESITIVKKSFIERLFHI